MKTRMVASLALASWVPLVTVAAAADGIPDALARIEVQTKSTLEQVGDPQTGLVAIGARIDLVGTAVSQVGKDVTAAVDAKGAQVLSAVEETHEAVTEVQASIERLRAPANLVWVSPFWTDEETGEEGGFPTPAHVFHPARIVVMNTGTATAHVGCEFLDDGGVLLIDRSKSLTIGPGATKTCHSFPDPPPAELERGSGSLIVHSDRPILVYGWYVNEIQFNTHQTQREAMQFVPVDCSNPAGIEAVCAVVP
jgi:hypothetical protein